MKIFKLVLEVEILNEEKFGTPNDDLLESLKEGESEGEIRIIKFEQSVTDDENAES